MMLDSGPFGPDNAWWHAESVDVPADLTGTGFSTGDIAHDFTLIDQHGDPVQFYQFYGQVVVLELFAEWCISCQSMSQKGQGLWEDLEGEDFVFISVMVEDNNFYPPEPTAVADWASRYNLTHPVLADETGDQLAYIRVGYPTVVIIDRDMTIIEPDFWPFDPGWIASLVR